MKKYINCANLPIRMSRKVFFSSAHLYKQNAWSESQNQKVFGKCFSEFGHGHNYTLEAFFEGPIDSQTGLLANLIDVDPILKQITDEFDHKHINFVHPHFKTLIPTTENIASYLWTAIQKNGACSPISFLKFYKMRLFEEPDLWVEVGL